MFFIHQKRTFAVSDGAPVLHRAGREIRYGYHVQCLERVRNVKIFFIKVQSFYCAVDREFCLMLFARRGKDPHFYISFGFGFYVFKISDNESEQISRHFWCGVEPDYFKTNFMFTDGYRQSVGNGRFALWYDKRNIKDCFLRRLVKAGESSARVGGFKLSGRHMILFSLDGVFTAVKSAHFIIKYSLKNKV